MSELQLKRIGLTGGIACGKSTVQQMILDAGWPVLDTDDVAHAVLETGSPVYEAVVREFGREILRLDGSIDRSILGKVVFADPERRKVLNALMHPEIGKRWRAWLDEQLQRQPRAVVAIPLLYEVGLENEFDHVLCVAASARRVMEHLTQRGLSEEAARQRVAAQWPVEQKAARADAVIRNDGSLADLETRVKEWMAAIGCQE